MTRTIRQSDDAAATQFLQQLGESHSKKASQPTYGRTMRDNFWADFGQPHGGFHAGRMDRLTEGWNPGASGPNRIHQMSARRMRERARDLVNNNPLARSAVEAWVTNVIRQGLDPKPIQKDRELRKAWLRAWHRWGGESAASLGVRECDIEGDSTIAELQALWLYEVLVGGGCLVHFREVSRRGRMLPLSLHLIPEERFADHIEYSGRNPKTANRVVNGIEVDGNNRTVAYHVLTATPNDTNYDPEQIVRIPAEQASYGYLKTRAGQKRGYTIMHPVIVWLWALGYYTDNELYASDVKSSWAYMITTTPEFADGGSFDTQALRDHEGSGTVDMHGNLITHHQPGMVFRGAPGDAITPVGPNVPGGDSMPWIMLIQRLICIGCSLSYEEAVRDYSKGSFSSVRAAMNSDRMRFKRMQQFAIDHCCNPTYGRFVMSASRSGIDSFPTPQQLVANIDEHMDVQWSLPGWQTVSPKDDAMAEDIKLKNGTLTRKSIVESNYGDIDEHFDQLEQEAEDARARNLSFSASSPWPDGQPSNSNDDSSIESEVDE